MSIIAIQSKGVLLDGDSFTTSKTSLRQVAFIKALAQTFRVVILTSHPQSKLFQAEHWAKSHAIGKEVVFYMTPLPDVEKVTALRSSGSFVSCYIGADPEICRDMVDAGIPTYYYAEGVYAFPEHREDVTVPGVTPWEELEQQVIQQQDILPKGTEQHDDDG